MWERLLGRIEAAQDWINLLSEDTQPINWAPCRAGHEGCKLEKNEFAKMLELEVIELAQTGWASCIVFAPKKEGTHRLSVDSRRFNAETVHNSYTNLGMDECIDPLGEVTIFWTVDTANNGQNYQGR